MSSGVSLDEGSDGGDVEEEYSETTCGSGVKEEGDDPAVYEVNESITTDDPSIGRNVISATNSTVSIQFIVHYYYSLQTYHSMYSQYLTLHNINPTNIVCLSECPPTRSPELFSRPLTPSPSPCGEKHTGQGQICTGIHHQGSHIKKIIPNL